MRMAYRQVYTVVVQVMRPGCTTDEVLMTFMY